MLATKGMWNWPIANLAVPEPSAGELASTWPDGLTICATEFGGMLVTVTESPFAR
jgi:hypothetical protein